jgi:hypothetical protein
MELTPLSSAFNPTVCNELAEKEPTKYVNWSTIVNARNIIELDEEETEVSQYGASVVAKRLANANGFVYKPDSPMKPNKSLVIDGKKERIGRVLAMGVAEDEFLMESLTGNFNNEPIPRHLKECYHNITRHVARHLEEESQYHIPWCMEDNINPVTSEFKHVVHNMPDECPRDIKLAEEYCIDLKAAIELITEEYDKARGQCILMKIQGKYKATLDNIKNMIDGFDN